MQNFANLISAEWTPPTSGNYQNYVPQSEFLDVVKGVQAANKALPAWSRLSLSERSQHLLKFAEVIETAFQKEFTNDSIPQALKVLHDFVELALEEAKLNEKRAYRLPIGVVAIITGQGEPLTTLLFKLIPALLMGNCILWKPSSSNPKIAQLIGEISLKAEWPAGIFNFIFGQGEQLGEAMIQHPAISTLAFVGRSETGLKVLKSAGDNSKKTLLSLGAKNASIVFADADLEALMPLIVKNAHDFQRSPVLRGSRVFVQDPIYKKFLELFKVETEKLRLGPVQSERQKHVFTKAVQQSLSETAKLLVGDKNPADLLIQPTAVFDLSFCSTVHQEEIDAPFVTISSFKYAHDAVKQANTSPFGQAAFVWSSDETRIEKFASKLEVGRVFFNQLGFVDAKRSFAPTKNSGFGGPEGGLSSFDFFSRRTEIW